MIHNIISKILRKTYNKMHALFIGKNPCLYEYKFDNLATKSNLSFIKDLDFVRYYSKSIEFGGRDYKFYLRVHQALWCASLAKNVEGDYIELGTGKGYIFAAVCEYMKDSDIDKQVYLFDTFLPFKTNKSTGEQKDSQKKSEFYADDYPSIKQKFLQYTFVELVQGKCPDSLKNIYSEKKRKIAFIHMDLNYYMAEIESFDYLWTYLSKGCVILLDDYANPGREVQYAAHEKYFKGKKLVILTTATGQGIAIKQ